MSKPLPEIGCEGVRPEHRDMVARMLKTHGSATVQRALADAGIRYSYHAVDAVRRTEEKAGNRARILGIADTSPLPVTDPRPAYSDGSEALYRATMRALDRLAKREGIPFAHAMDLAHMGRDRFELARVRAA